MLFICMVASLIPRNSNSLRYQTQMEKTYLKNRFSSTGILDFCEESGVHLYPSYFKRHRSNVTGLGGERGRVDLCQDKNLAFPAQEEQCNTPTARTRGKPSVLTAPFPHTAPEHPDKSEEAPGRGFNPGPSPQDERGRGSAL